MSSITVILAAELAAVIDQAEVQLRAVSAEAAALRPGPGKWSKLEIVGHLVDSAMNNHPRFVRGQLVPFLAVPPYEQDRWVALQGYQEADWQQLITLWKLLNERIAVTIRRTPAEVLAHQCQVGEFAPVTLEFLMKDYVVHLRHHLVQLAVVL